MAGHVRGKLDEAFVASVDAKAEALLKAPGRLRLDQGFSATSYDRTAKVWDVATGDEIVTYEGHTNVVSSVYRAHQGDAEANGDALQAGHSAEIRATAHAREGIS